LARFLQSGEGRPALGPATQHGEDNNMIMTRDRYISATAIAAVMALAAATALAPQAAKADAISYSSLDIDNFGFGITPATNTTVSISNVHNVSNLSAVLNGSSVSDGGDSITLPLDVSQQCVPAGCGGIGQNDFSQHSATTQISRGDSLISSPTSANAPSGAPATAHSQQVAETNLSNPGSGSANTRNGLVASFSFVLSGPGQGGGSFDLSFDATQLMSVLLGTPNGSVEASSAFRITVTDPDNNVAFDWSPNGLAGGVGGYIGGTEIFDPFSLNTGISRTDNTSPADKNNTGVFEVASNQFASDVTYDVTIQSNADTFATLRASPVNEPAYPALFGGLVFLAGMFLRRRRGF
jgi:hypothetical protein